MRDNPPGDAGRGLAHRAGERARDLGTGAVGEIDARARRDRRPHGPLRVGCGGAAREAATGASATGPALGGSPSRARPYAGAQRRVGGGGRPRAGESASGSTGCSTRRRACRHTFTKRWMAVMAMSTTMSHMTGTRMSNARPMARSTMRSARSMMPPLAEKPRLSALARS